MAESKKSGKTALRSVDGIKAAGMCVFSIGPKGIEASVSAQLPESLGTPEAVLQYGPEREYLCRPPVTIDGPIRCSEPGVMAVWVLGAGKPALFGLLGNGAFDAVEARRHLPEPDTKVKKTQTQFKIASVTQPAEPVQANPMVRPTYREPASKEPAVSFLPTGQQPYAAAPAKDTPIHAQGIGISAATATTQGAKTPATQTIGGSQPLPSARQQYSAAHQQPLVVKRAPRPTPHTPVYSPLWDDVSNEFEKMLDSLPQVQPFNGNAENAEIVEVPTGGAVQCYVGSVTINGMKVFLQAVPARPYARPAGFDHSLVSRSGESYWVKYFIHNS